MDLRRINVQGQQMPEACICVSGTSSPACVFEIANLSLLKIRRLSIHQLLQGSEQIRGNSVLELKLIVSLSLLSREHQYGQQGNRLGMLA